MKLRFTPQAIEDLSAIGDFLAARNPQAARRVRAAILESLQHLLLFPRSDRRQRVEGVRKHVTRRYRYLIYYTVDDVGDEIVVVSIMHSAREREFPDT